MSDTRSPLERPKSGAGKHIKAKEILEEERIARTQHLQPLKVSMERSQKSTKVRSSSPTFVGETTAEPIRIGVVGAARVARKNAGAISNPSSLCSVVAVASREWEKGAAFIDEWCKRHDGGGEIVVKGGEKSYDDLITSNDLVDALYIPLPTQMRKEWVLKALETGKHVLIELPVSMTVADYLEMIEAAKKASKFLMDGTMFMHHHRLEMFLDHVASEKMFGNIKSIYVEFSVMHDDENMDDHVWPSQHDDPYGVIGSLGWYCVRFGLLVYTQVGLGAVRSVQVLEVGKNDAGHPMDAKCIVTFDKDHVMTLHCSFAHHTRQKAEVIGDENTAIIYDFAFPHQNFTSYQVHQKATKDKENHSVEAFDTIECGAGPPQEVMMWRTFSQLCRGIDEAVAVAKLNPKAGGNVARDIGWGDSDASREALELSSVSLQTQVIVDALMESIHQDGAEILLPYSEL